jgi:putative heme iron utilization protein
LENIRLNVNEKARTVTSVCTSGTLCTLSTHEGMEGAPFGSFVDYVLDDRGNPILLMNDMSMHTLNIHQTEAATGKPAVVTLFTQLAEAKKGLQDVSRCSLTGKLIKMDTQDPDMDTVRMRYSLTHAYADQVMDSPKFSFYRLEPSKIYFVGGFGVLAKWVDPSDYQEAAPDILASSAADIVEQINRDHGEDLRLTARHLLGVGTEIERIRMTSVDRLGMDIRVTSQLSTRRNKLQTDEFRIGFRIPVQSVEDAKSEILKVFQEAWEKGNGFSWGDEEAPGESVPIMKIAADSLE